MEPKVDGFQSSIFEKHYQKNMNFKIKDQLSKDFYLNKSVNFEHCELWKNVKVEKVKFKNVNFVTYLKCKQMVGHE